MRKNMTKNVLWLLSAAVLTLLPTGCLERLYEGEGDCSVTYVVNFRYDYNMLWADAFAHEVEGVTLYVLDSGTKQVVWQKTERGSALASEGYAMTVEVPEGTYDLLVWAGGNDLGTWNIPNANARTGLTCTLNSKQDARSGAYTDTDLDRLYYGYVERQTFGSKPVGVQTFTVPLMKDTNHITVVLQHTSGEPAESDKFTFTITDDNGSMDWDNSLLEGGTITYYAWHTEQGEAEFETSTEPDGIEPVSTRATFSAAVAELTTARLMESHRDETRLTVTNNETGDTVFSIPLVQFVTMVKGYYNSNMDNQEYLDRQDDYSLVFFLDEGDRWVDTYIYINSWKVVLQTSSL